jgi:hypothetical protein
MEDLVTYQMSKKLKEKGFPITGKEIIYEGNGVFIPTPTFYQVLKWMREEKKLHVEPCVISREEVEFAPKYTYWSFGIMSIEGGYFIYQEYHKFNDDKFDSYEDAALAGIEYVLDNLI